jgi:hypothetical protein
MGRANIEEREVCTFVLPHFSTNERCFNIKLTSLLADGLPRYAKLPLERRWMRRQEAPLAIINEARPSRLPVILKVKTRVVLQVNGAAVSLRLVVFGSKEQLFYKQITEQTGGERGERREERGATPLHCCDG